jgi:hypothetical protein
MQISVDVEGIDELVDQILQVTEGIDDATPELTRLALDIQNQLRRGRFEDQTGNLRRSMRAYVQDNSIAIRMLYYGYYLSFGVRPGQASPLTQEVASVFRGKSEGSFFARNDENSGIAARRFYPTNIEDMIVDRLEAIASQLQD